MATSDDIHNLLEHWMDVKNQLSDLELSLSKYKKLASKIMSKNDTTTLYSDNYVLQQRNISKKTLSKDDVPKEIWNKYAKTTTYTAYYLSKK
jgi:hypothetical protein